MEGKSVAPYNDTEDIFLGVASPIFRSYKYPIDIKVKRSSPYYGYNKSINECKDINYIGIIKKMINHPERYSTSEVINITTIFINRINSLPAHKRAYMTNTLIYNEAIRLKRKYVKKGRDILGCSKDAKA